MLTRQQHILDAAIKVLGNGGSRSLTHRSVDAEAGLPSGSASNYFRSRSALISGIVGRMEERDYEEWAQQSAGAAVQSTTEFADLLTGLVATALTTGRIRTQARYAIFVEAAVAGAGSVIAQSIERSRANLRTWGAGLASTLGLPEPHRAASMLVDYLDGVIVHQLTKAVFDQDAVRAEVLRFLTGLGGTEEDG
jgi:DNA-binding transcriptional regulator YbjK